MGWRGTLRSVNAAAKKSAREAEKRENALNRVHNKLDKNVDQVFAKIASFDKKATSDPIKALNLRFHPDEGFEADPFELSTDVFSGQIGLSIDEESNWWAFQPSKAKTNKFAVKPLDMLICEWGTVVAIRIDNFDPEYRIRTPWFKKTDPQNSSIYIIDPVSSTYYYPISSSLTGEVVAGHSKIGLIAFEKFRYPTDKVEIHISDVKLSSDRGKRYTLHFTIEDTKLVELIDEELDRLPFTVRAEETINKEVEHVRQQLPSNSGCLVFVAFILNIFGFVSYIIAQLAD